MGILFIIDGALGKNKASVINYAERSAKNNVIKKVFHYPKTYRFHRQLSPDLEREIKLYDKFREEIIENDEYYHYSYEDKEYGFRKAYVTESLANFNYVFVVVRNTSLIRTLKNDYESQSFVVYIHTDKENIDQVLQGYPSRKNDYENVQREYIASSEIYDEVLINNDHEDPTSFYGLFDNIIKKVNFERPKELRLVSGEKFNLVNEILAHKENIRIRLKEYESNVFLITNFTENREIYNFIRNQLKFHKLNCICIDDSKWQITGDIYNSIAILYCCKYGIAIFDETEKESTFSSIAGYGLGIMHTQGKDCLILKHDMLKDPFLNSAANIYYSTSKEVEFETHISNWLKKIGKTKDKS
jgi:hypothetical protein